MTPFRILLSSIVTAARHPRVWLLALAITAAAAALAVAPMARAWVDELAHHPGADTLLDPALDPDFERARSDVTLRLTGAMVFVALAWSFLAGGVLGAVGIAGTRFRFRAFLVACASAWPRVLRVLVLAAVPLLLLFWGADALGSWLWGERLHDAEPGYWLTLARFAWDLALGFVFLLVLFVAKMAMAGLVARDRSSALLAWLAAAGRAARHPWTVAVLVAGFAIVWLALTHAIGMATATALEVRRDLVLGAVCGETGIAVTQVLLVAQLLAARAMLPPAAAGQPADAGLFAGAFEDGK